MRRNGIDLTNAVLRMQSVDLLRSWFAMEEDGAVKSENPNDSLQEKETQDLQVDQEQDKQGIGQEAAQEQEFACDAILERIGKAEEKLDSIVSALNRNDKKLDTYIKWNVDFDNQVRNRTQKELEECKERESGSFNLPIVKDLLSVYFDYLDIMASVKPSDSPDGNHDKTVGMLISLFDDIEDILIRNGIEFVESAENSARSMFSSKVIQTIETDRKELHNCVVRSRRKGAVYGKQALVREYVDVYVFNGVSEKE